MSDSDEFGGLAPTTPLPTANGKRKARPDKPPSRTLDAAGPSNGKPPGNTATGSDANSRKKTKAGNSNKGKQLAPAADMDMGEEGDSDIQEMVEVGSADEEEEGLEAAPPPPRQQRGGRKPVSKDSAAPVRTAVASSKAKGKQVAQKVPPTRRQRKENAADGEHMDVMEVDSDQDVVNIDGAATTMDLAAAFNSANGTAPTKANRKTSSAGANSTSHRSNIPPQKSSGKPGHDAKLVAENTRLKEETERLREHIDDLKAKFEELMHTRHTEPEALMEEMVHTYEAQINLQNKVIKDLHAQLAKKEPLLLAATPAEKKLPFCLISRDEADEEMRECKTQIHNLKIELASAKNIIAEKNTEVDTLKQQGRDTERELAEEIKRSEQLSKQNRHPPSSATRGNPILKGEDPKTTKLIRLYEDLTNILVPHIKYSTKPSEGEEWTFTSIYTWKDDIESKAKEKSLNFSLRLCKEPLTEDPGILVDSVHYHPLQLEKESREFVDNLGFLNKPFSFPHTQLSLFVRTLYDNLNSPQDDEDDD